MTPMTPITPIRHDRPGPAAVADQVNNPTHYNSHPSGIEAIAITAGFCFSLGNVIKYVWRAGLKDSDPMPDLLKARWYLDYHIKALEEQTTDGRSD